MDYSSVLFNLDKYSKQLHLHNYSNSKNTVKGEYSNT